MTSDQTTAELKPCPFCGGEASVIGVRDGRQVSCKGQPWGPCFAKGPIVFHGPRGWDACEAEAITAWNRRPLEATQSPDEEVLGEAMFNLSARLKEAGFLDDDANHAAYEAVVAAFAALSTPSRIEPAK